MAVLINYANIPNEEFLQSKSMLMSVNVRLKVSTDIIDVYYKMQT